MLGVTAAAGTTAGFAWFTTIRTATVNFSNAVVYNKAAGLSVTYVSVTNGGVATPTVTTGQTIDLSGNTSAVTDISGNGEAFYKPIWKPGSDGTTASEIDAVANGATTKYFVQFDLQLTNSGTAEAHVYLDSGSAVSGVSGSAADVAAAQSTRVSIWDVTSAHAIRTIWQDDPTDGAANTNYQYISSNSAGTAYGATGTLSNPDNSTFHLGAFTAVTVASTKANGQLIADLAASATATVRVTIWIEGTLSLATNTAVGGQVKTALALAAI